MAVNNKKSYFCERCNRTLDEDNFYSMRNGEKTTRCKKCLTAHVDVFKQETFLWIFEMLDVPFISAEWNTLRDREYAKDPDKVMNSPAATIGKYLGKMRLKTFKDYGWEDSDKLNQQTDERRRLTEEERQREEEVLRQQFMAGEISEAQYRTLVSVDLQAKDDQYRIPAAAIGFNNTFNEADFVSEEVLPDPAAALTEDDKVYLVVKWGRNYKLNELIALEKDYTSFKESFGIKDEDTLNALVLLCKTYLKMNQALDCGDIDGYQKLARVYDQLRKSMNLTAAQNKREKGDYVDCVGQMVVICEREGGFIPRFPTDIPQDKVDYTLRDMNNYVYNLVTKDLGFGQQIEDAIKKMQIQMQQAQSEAEGMEEGYYKELEDEDFKDFYELKAEMEEEEEEDE